VSGQEVAGRNVKPRTEGLSVSDCDPRYQINYQPFTNL
jgi:hypothetical protein